MRLIIVVLIMCFGLNSFSQNYEYRANAGFLFGLMDVVPGTVQYQTFRDTTAKLLNFKVDGSELVFTLSKKPSMLAFQNNKIYPVDNFKFMHLFIDKDVDGTIDYISDKGVNLESESSSVYVNMELYYDNQGRIIEIKADYLKRHFPYDAIHSFFTYPNDNLVKKEEIVYENGEKTYLYFELDKAANKCIGYKKGKEQEKINIDKYDFSKSTISFYKNLNQEILNLDEQ